MYHHLFFLQTHLRRTRIIITGSAKKPIHRKGKAYVPSVVRYHRISSITYFELQKQSGDFLFAVPLLSSFGHGGLDNVECRLPLNHRVSYLRCLRSKNNKMKRSRILWDRGEAPPPPNAHSFRRKKEGGRKVWWRRWTLCCGFAAVQ